jgi:hypothetical protein
LGLPPDGNLRRWLGGSWNDGLTRALLDAVTDGDSAMRPIGLNQRFEDGEVMSALRECADELGSAAWRRSVSEGPACGRVAEDDHTRERPPPS